MREIACVQFLPISYKQNPMYNFLSDTLLKLVSTRQSHVVHYSCGLFCPAGRPSSLPPPPSPSTASRAMSLFSRRKTPDQLVKLLRDALADPCAPAKPSKDGTVSR